MRGCRCARQHIGGELEHCILGSRRLLSGKLVRVEGRLKLSLVVERT